MRAGLDEGRGQTKGVEAMKNKSVRAVGIALAVILGRAALLYLGGLINQLTIGYQKWLAPGGMTRKGTQGATHFSPPVCWRRAPAGGGPQSTLPSPFPI